jgi:hypothetical protein
MLSGWYSNGDLNVVYCYKSQFRNGRFFGLLHKVVMSSNKLKKRFFGTAIKFQFIMISGRRYKLINWSIIYAHHCCFHCSSSTAAQSIIVVSFWYKLTVIISWEKSYKLPIYKNKYGLKEIERDKVSGVRSGKIE